MSKTVHVISRETLSFSFCWYGVFFHLHCCTFQQETQNKIVQASFFGERNYDQVEKSIWECWHWPFSSFSPWLPLKMRYSKTLVICRTNKNVFLRRQERCWLIVFFFLQLLGYLVTTDHFESNCPGPFSAVLSALPPVSFVSINGSIIVVTMQWILTHNKTTLKRPVFLNTFGSFIFCLYSEHSINLVWSLRPIWVGIFQKVYWYFACVVILPVSTYSIGIFVLWWP